MDDELTRAAFDGDVEAVGRLLDAGADVNAGADGWSWNPLHAAIENHNVACVQLLIRRGADVERLSDGMSPLAHAVDIAVDGTIQAGGEQGDEPTDIIELLLDAGADPASGLELARQYKSAKVIALLTGTAKHITTRLTVVRLYARGLGIILCSGIVRGELVAAPSVRRRETLYDFFLDDQRTVRIGTGSPELNYELVFSLDPPPNTQAVRDTVTFRLRIDDDTLRVCDGHAELDWTSDSYQHELIAIPTGYYRVDAYYLADPGDARNDMLIFFHLVPTLEHRAPVSPFVELIFRRAETKAEGEAMDEVNGRRLDGWSWAIFFVRWVLGLIFFMAGWWKTFDLGPTEHARKLFVEPYADTWLPVWLLWASGTVIPIVELVAGALMCLGLRVREAGIAFGVILIIVDYGHLLKEPLFDTTHHIFPRLVLLTFVLAAPAGRDLLSLDAWLGWRARSDGEERAEP